MTDINVNPGPAGTAPPPRPRRWLRVLAWTLGVLIVLIVGLYFAATSSTFLKSVILPQVGKSLQAEVTVADASIHPFREIILRNLKIQPPGQEPVLTAPEVRVRYRLLDILRGNIRVDEITLSEPTVLIVENPDGTRNLDPILKAQAKAAPEKKAAPPGPPPRLDLAKLTVRNATFREEKRRATGRPDIAELARVNVTLENLKNGETGKMSLSADAQFAQNPAPPAAPALLQAAWNGSFTFTLLPDLKPASIDGRSELVVARAEGALSGLAGTRATLNCALTPTELKELALRFQRNNESLGGLVARGPLDLAKAEGRVNVELLPIDKRVLNLLGATSGLDFGATTLDSTNEIQLANAGATITTVGRFNVSRLQLTHAGRTTPRLDLHADYNVTLDNAAGRALLRTLVLEGTGNGAPLLRAELTSPMTLAWGKSSTAVGDSALTFAITNLNLNDWKPFLGDTAPGGQAGLIAHLLSQQGGRRLTLDLDASLEHLSAAAGAGRITQADVALQARGEAADLKRFNLTQCKLQVSHQGQPALTISGSGQYDLEQQNADGRVSLQAPLTGLFALLQQPDLKASSGTAELQAQLAQKQKTQTVTGNLRLTDFTGQIGRDKFNAFGARADLDVARTPEQIRINRIAGTLAAAGNPGGSFDASGAYDLNHKSATLKATLQDLNQNGLRPFLDALLADRKLVSIAVNGSVAAQYDPADSSALQTQLAVTNLVVSDPRRQLPATPLEAKLAVDAGVRKQSADLRQFQITLTPTPRAQNQVQLQGHVDFSQTNAIQGRLKLAADSLDLTRYYDLFAGQKAAAAKGSPPPAEAAPAPAPARAGQEPPAQTLPFRDFNLQVDIGRVYLREVEITNLQTAVNLDAGRVSLKPCQLILNGAPMSATADLDLGVPGYKYGLTFEAGQVPFAPLVNTFAPDRKGQLSGALTARARINGAGTTGASLQKSLTGQFDFGATNLNFSVDNARSPLLKTLISVVAAVPELLHNPTGAIGSLLGGLTGRGGLMNELMKAPIDIIAARGSAGAGTVELQSALVQSAAFQALAQGNIKLAPVLSNSPVQIPVTVALSHPIAQQLNLAGESTATNTAYVALPSFLTVKGTLGETKADINKLALVGTTLKAVTPTVPGTGAKPGGLLGDVEGLLGARRAGSNNVSTNPPAAKPPPVSNPLNSLFGPRKR